MGLSSNGGALLADGTSLKGCCCGCTFQCSGQWSLTISGLGGSGSTYNGTYTGTTTSTGIPFTYCGEVSSGSWCVVPFIIGETYSVVVHLVPITGGPPNYFVRVRVTGAGGVIHAEYIKYYGGFPSDGISIAPADYYLDCLTGSPPFEDDGINWDEASMEITCVE